VNYLGHHQAARNSLLFLLCLVNAGAVPVRVDVSTLSTRHCCCWPERLNSTG